MSARVLVIEDNPANLDLMTYLLRAFGHTVLCACDGAQGLEAAREQRPDLIICDIQMPVMDGLEVAHRLKQDPELRAIRLVAVTALAMVGDRDRMLAAGFDAYIAKPIDPETFARQVQGLLCEAPSSAASPAPSITVSPAVDEGTGPVVLVVDDLWVNLELARSILQPFGYRVLSAAGASAALRIAQENACDLILSDVCMSEGSGFDLVRAVRADPRLHALPVILITSTYASEGERAKGLAVGANDYLFRPIEPEALLTAISSRIRMTRDH